MRLIATFVILFSTSTLAVAEDSLPTALDAGWKGQKVCELLEEDEMIRVVRCTFPPGVGHERHFHPAHFGYTLRAGDMEITDASGVRVIKGKQDVYWQSDGVPWHEAVNVGDHTAEYLIVEKKY
jgi:hypothetical protein